MPRVWTLLQKNPLIPAAVIVLTNWLSAAAQTVTRIIDATGDGANILDNPLRIAVGNVYVVGNASEVFKIEFPAVATRRIIIIKETVPDNAQAFLFTTAGGLTPPFNLDDDADGTVANTQTFASVPAGTYTVTEPIFGGVTLDNLICLDPGLGSVADLATATAAIDLVAGETVTCTFQNQVIGITPAPGPVGILTLPQ